jgi:hypothetical protein
MTGSWMEIWHRGQIIEKAEDRALASLSKEMAETKSWIGYLVKTATSKETFSSICNSCFILGGQVPGAF